MIARFNAEVGVPVGDDGKPTTRPAVRELRSDHEGGLESHAFQSFRENASLHSSMSPPHDHDLNPIAESTMGVIDTNATAARSLSGSPASFWPWLIRNSVDIHNTGPCDIGSSAGDKQLTPYQRFTLRQPACMDLLTFGSRAVILKPPEHQRKGDLSSRGWVGKLLGRSSSSVGAYDVWVDAIGRVVTSSSVLADEEYFPWRGKDAFQPLTPSSRAPMQPANTPLGVPITGSATNNIVPSIAPHSSVGASLPVNLSFLDLFSGFYYMTGGLADRMKSFGWTRVDTIDNNSTSGGGWNHDLLNDAKYAELLDAAKRGAWHGMMVALPCSPYSIARFNDAFGDGHAGGRGPPPLYTREFPDGLPFDKVDPSHHRELRESRTLLDRVTSIMAAARRSPSKTTIVFENPADRSISGTSQYSPDLANHGSVFGTTAFKLLLDSIGPTSAATFAQCRFAGQFQKYTTFVYTNDAASVLDPLHGPDYQCNHSTGEHSRVAGGRRPDGSWVSSEAAATPTNSSFA